MVFDAVVVAAEGGEVVDGGGSAVFPRLGVVEVVVGRGYAAAGEHTGRLLGFDESLLGGVWSPAGGPGP